MWGVAFTAGSLAKLAAAGGSDLQAMLDRLPADSDPETVEFDRQLRWALFRRAAEQVRREVQPATWQAFWETGVLGTSPAEAAQKLAMSVGAVRVAKYRVLTRLREALQEREQDL